MNLVFIGLFDEISNDVNTYVTFSRTAMMKFREHPALDSKLGLLLLSSSIFCLISFPFDSCDGGDIRKVGLRPMLRNS